MKIILLFFVLTAVLLSGCNSTVPESTDSSEQSDIISEEEEISMGDPDITNLNYQNTGKMGDDDGPAYAIYSKQGYNIASIDVMISEIKLNNIRKSDGKFVNAYIFLGMDIFNEDGYWVNCLDTGFCYSGKDGGWHLFYHLYTTEDESTPTWYESKVILNPNNDYRLTLDSSEEDGRARVTIYDITEDKLVDSKELEAAYSLADGSNTAYLQNYALDYPGDVKYDTEGNKSENDWVEITLYNTDEDLYMNYLTVKNVKIGKNDSILPWTEEHTNNRSTWPDMGLWEDGNVKIDYPIVQIWIDKYDESFTLCFDMNRK